MAPKTDILQLPAKSGNFHGNITLTDIQLATVYYDVLIDLAMYKLCLTYGELVERAKRLYPDRPFVQKALASSAGRRLDVVRNFTSECGLPNLTSLILNKSSGGKVIGLTRHADLKKTIEEVFAFDWTSVNMNFAGFVKRAESVIRLRDKVKK